MSQHEPELYARAYEIRTQEVFLTLAAACSDIPGAEGLRISKGIVRRMHEAMVGRDRNHAWAKRRYGGRYARHIRLWALTWAAGSRRLTSVFLAVYGNGKGMDWALPCIFDADKAAAMDEISVPESDGEDDSEDELWGTEDEEEDGDVKCIGCGLCGEGCHSCLVCGLCAAWDVEDRKGTDDEHAVSCARCGSRLLL